jgi:hypothetical protein
MYICTSAPLRQGNIAPDVAPSAPDATAPMTLTGDAAMCLRVMCRAIRMKRNWFSARTSALAKRVFSGFGPITITDDDLDRPERAFDKFLDLNLYRHRAGSAGVRAHA